MDLLGLLEYIDPAVLEYQKWINVGMALKQEGYAASDWDEWSQKDYARYHSGECYRKWETFQGSGAPVTGGTIVQMAKEHGWTPSGGKEAREIDWNGEIGGREDLVLIDRNWIEGKELTLPQTWDPVQQLTAYLETLFEAGENVGYVTRSWEKDGKFLPTKGCWDRTAGQLLQQLSKCGGDIGSVLGDYDPQAGAWIRFNPLDGKGVKNENVTEFRYALVESDTMEIEKQNAIIRELELPVACLVYSGKKSLHAIVRIDAVNYAEYRQRVDYLYAVCEKNGLKIDRQNRNPSRLSRMPGVMRGSEKQMLLDTNIGKESWIEWKEWIESVTDELPDTESLADVWDAMPELAPPLIDGVLRQGHKMLIAGPSKAGKSYALIELCIAVAEGKKWLQWQCTQGKVLYVNLELDRASCLHRFKDVYTALEWAPEHLADIDIWNLRGNSLPMDKLAPKLIRRAAKKGYLAIIIDPIYKVITGDENSADQMSHFCNQFDKVCTELGCAVIYCHHHSKGAQGGKRSMDRASGSGVFARDPDALLDLIELEMTEDLKKQEQNKAVCAVCREWLKKYDLEDCASQDDCYSETQILAVCREYLEDKVYKCVLEDVAQARAKTAAKTAWRIEGTLREYPKFAPLNLWFDYPVHRRDDSGALQDLQSENAGTWQKNFTKKKKPAEREKSRKEAIDAAFEACAMGENEVAISELAEYMGVTEKTVRARLKEHGNFYIDDGKTGKKGK